MAKAELLKRAETAETRLRARLATTPRCRRCPPPNGSAMPSAQKP